MEIRIGKDEAREWCMVLAMPLETHYSVSALEVWRFHAAHILTSALCGNVWTEDDDSPAIDSWIEGDWAFGQGVRRLMIRQVFLDLVKDTFEELVDSYEMNAVLRHILANPDDFTGLALCEGNPLIVEGYSDIEDYVVRHECNECSMTTDSWWMEDGSDCDAHDEGTEVEEETP